MTWTTLLDPVLTRRYGCGAAHGAWFVPRKCPPPPRNTIALLIPECELQFNVPGVETVFVNRPRENRNVRAWLKHACREASDHGAILIVACDTAEQTERAAKLASKLLPKHERAAIERIYEEQARAGLH
jgi:hypothetical protein